MFIIDHVIMVDEHQGVIREYFFRGRHINVDIIILYYDIIRDYANLIVSFKHDDKPAKDTSSLRPH